MSKSKVDIRSLGGVSTKVGTEEWTEEDHG